MKQQEEEIENQEQELSFDMPEFEIPDFDFSMFDIIGETDGIEARYVKPKLYQSPDRSQIKYENAVKLAQDLRLKQGERADVLVPGSFIFGDFIEAYVTTHNVKIERMIISTLSLSQDNVDSLANLIKGNYVDKLDLLISHYFYAHERHALVPYIYQELDIDDKFQLAVLGSHTKTCIFKTSGGKHIVIQGSANLRSSANLEQFTIEDNDEVYKFHEEWQDRVIEKYKTINKAVRVKPLWNLINTKKFN